MKKLQISSLFFALMSAMHLHGAEIVLSPAELARIEEDTAEFKQYLSDHPEFNINGRDRYTPLSRALNNPYQTLSYIACGVDVNKPNEAGLPPLHDALCQFSSSFWSYRGPQDKVRRMAICRLIEAKADIRQTEQYVATPEGEFIQAERQRPGSSLLLRLTDTVRNNYNTRTNGLMVAASSGCSQAVALMLKPEMGGREIINEVTSEGYSALVLSVHSGLLDEETDRSLEQAVIARSLLDAKADHSIGEKDKRSFLELAEMGSPAFRALAKELRLKLESEEKDPKKRPAAPGGPRCDVD